MTLSHLFFVLDSKLSLRLRPDGLFISIDNVANRYDLKAVAGAAGSIVNFSDVGAGPGPMGPSRMLTRKPTIAAISGYAVAGGLELALLCDLRVVDETAVMGVFCRRFGVPLIDGGTVRLPAIIGMTKT